MGGRGEVIVDENSRTSVPSIYAVGDVTDRINLTPVAIAEGHVFADRTYGGMNRIISRQYCLCRFQPAAHCPVGLNEAEADERFAGITVFESRPGDENTISAALKRAI